MTTQKPVSSTDRDSFLLWYLPRQLPQAGHEWFIERKMTPHVVTRLICLTGTAAFPRIQHRRPVWKLKMPPSNCTAQLPSKTFIQCSHLAVLTIAIKHEHPTLVLKLLTEIYFVLNVLVLIYVLCASRSYCQVKPNCWWPLLSLWGVSFINTTSAKRLAIQHRQ